ncbi:MAG: competence protein CoiA family protein [Anaerolineae bacterium]|nr:competence protein CoiA [Anaerolineae bacterium]MDW8298421.1 competence protein CoiA family protein [Anaerolineae bacterium]
MDKLPVEYRWALNAEDRPVPITLAQRGERYTCPLCRNAMVARLGAQLQHHFGHLTTNRCNSEAVSIAALRRWLAMHLDQALNERRAMPFTWQCALCNQTHSQNLLENVSHVLEELLNAPESPDVRLTDAQGTQRAAFYILGEGMPLPQSLQQSVGQGSFAFALSAALLPESDDLVAFLATLKPSAAPCPLWDDPAVVRQPERLRRLLINLANRPPYYFFGAVETIDGLVDVVRVGRYRVWAAFPFWQRVVGGTLNRLSPDVEIFIQNWDQPDGGTIYLYYVRIRETRAIALRRYPLHSAPSLRVDDRYRLLRFTALDMARELVSK